MAGSSPTYFVMTLVAIRSIRDAGSKSDIVLMQLGPIDPAHLEVYEAEGVRVISVAKMPTNNFVPAEEFHADPAVYLAKLRVFQLVEYRSVVFFDVDFQFYSNPDKLMDSSFIFLGKNGPRSPFNAGVFAVKQSLQYYNDIEDMLLSNNFNLETGWMEYGNSKKLRTPFTRGWRFHGASIDQGLIFYYFFFHLAKDHPVGMMHFIQSNSLCTHFSGENKPSNIHHSTSIPQTLRPAFVVYVDLVSRLRDEYAILVPITQELVSLFHSGGPRNGWSHVLDLCPFILCSMLVGSLHKATVNMCIVRVGIRMSLCSAVLWSADPQRAFVSSWILPQRNQRKAVPAVVKVMSE
jgi:hypothetical protein